MARRKSRYSGIGGQAVLEGVLSLIHISEPTRP